MYDFCFLKLKKLIIFTKYYDLVELWNLTESGMGLMSFPT